MEQVLGIQPTGAGFSAVDIRPDLIDLDWAKGAEPTPQGLLKVDLRKSGTRTAIILDLPAEVSARVAVPVSSSIARITVNGSAVKAISVEDGTRMLVILDHAGHYELVEQ
jgi:hypothetical protein